MKTTTYLCECGKSNLIKTKKRPDPSVPIFFFCGGCGKPNYDFCTKCGHQTPIRYENQFCTGCGAGDQEIKKGRLCADVWGSLRELILPAIPLLIAINLIIYFHEPFQKWQMEKIKEPIPTPLIWISLILLYLMGVRQIMAIFIAPLETLLTGSKTPSFSARLIARWLYWEDKPAEKAEQRLTQEALKIRTRARWLIRKLRRAQRQIRSRNSSAGYMPSGDSSPIDEPPISDCRD